MKKPQSRYQQAKALYQIPQALTTTTLSMCDTALETCLTQLETTILGKHPLILEGLTNLVAMTSVKAAQCQWALNRINSQNQTLREENLVAKLKQALIPAHSQLNALLIGWTDSINNYVKAHLPNTESSLNNTESSLNNTRGQISLLETYFNPSNPSQSVMGVLMRNASQETLHEIQKLLDNQN